MRWREGFRKRLRDDGGSALTEFAIVAPLFIILIYWSQFFADLGILKLKAEEAARYAAWEMTAQRAPGAVSSEVRTRFANLASPVEYSGGRPHGTLSWNAVTVDSVTIDDRIQAPFTGQIRRPPSDGGFIGDLMVGIANFLNRAADWIVKQLKFDTAGAARAEVRFRVRNTLFPSGQLLGIFFDTGINPEIVVTANSPRILWNTWKAWPGKSFGGSTETDVYETYPRISSRASAPENVVSTQVGKMSFFGVGSYLGAADPVFDFLSLPRMFGSATWRERRSGDGPIAMLPGAVQSKSWQPGYQTPLQRVGDEWGRTTATTLAPRGSMHEGADRQRFTTPSTIKTVEWRSKDDSGKSVRQSSPVMVRDAQNPYVRMYRCRDAFYMGSTRGELQRYNQPNWARQAHPGCQ